MEAILVMYTMHLRPLKEKADPMWSLDIGMIEKLSYCRAKSVDSAGLK
jgi:hypothetical protein